MTTLLSRKLEGDELKRNAENEIRALHNIFVTWFRGEEPLPKLKSDLHGRMAPAFSHVAPNGHMVQGSDVLITYLTDKYACYSDRTFTIDVYNVQILYSTEKFVLASYEEWQSWDDNNSNNDGSEGEGEENTGNGKQQFGRLSTCLLERSSTTNNESQNSNSFRWIHVHETWMEAEEPTMIVQTTPSVVRPNEEENNTVMTGPVLPAAAANNASNTSMTAANKQGGGDDDDDANNVTDKQFLVVIDSNCSKDNRVQDQNQSFVMETLTELNVDFDLVDNAQQSQVERTKELLQLSELEEYPQFFLIFDDEDGEEAAEFWGTYTDFVTCYNKGSLAKDVLVAQYQDDDEMDELADKVGGLTTTKDDEEPEENQFASTEERQFMEASQGILFFEDEGDDSSSPGGGGAAAAAVAVANKPSANLDDFMDITDDDEDNQDDDNQDVSENVLKDPSNDVAMNSSQAMLSLHSASGKSHKRHVSPKLEKHAKPLVFDNSLVGVSIAGFDIGTSQGNIADTQWMSETESKLEKYGQHVLSKPRKLLLPEMVFPVAHVALEGHGIWLSWDAYDCLLEWSKAHDKIPVQHTDDIDDSEILSNNLGVSILKTKDAKTWQAKHKRNTTAMKDSSGSSDAKYHYDWTYSSPFTVKTEGGEWIELDESGMRMDLLKDKSIPILFFDEILLFEDDMHDNGQVHFCIKLRIMPTCAYILARLFVRVDSVIVRVRETRLLVDFFGIQPQVYRDVSWRECPWEDLPGYGLPTDVKMWKCEPGSETPEWNALVQRLPDIELPKEILKHATLEYGVSVGNAAAAASSQEASETLEL